MTINLIERRDQYLQTTDRLTLKWKAIGRTRTPNFNWRELRTEIRSHVFIEENGWDI